MSDSDNKISFSVPKTWNKIQDGHGIQFYFPDRDNTTPSNLAITVFAVPETLANKTLEKALLEIFLIRNNIDDAVSIEFIDDKRKWPALESYIKAQSGHVYYLYDTESSTAVELIAGISDDSDDFFSTDPILSVLESIRFLFNTDNQLNNTPHAWFGQAHAGKIGEIIEFNASGSYDPSMRSLTLYEWDFNADGVIDYESQKDTASYTYTEKFNDYVTLYVTGPSGTASTSARTVINEQGYASMGDEEPCKLDEDGYSIFIHDGIFLRCTLTHLPTEDKPGVRVHSGDLQ